MDKTILVAAHNQWANRPADQTFTSVRDLFTECLRFRKDAQTATVALNSLRVEALSGGVQLVGRQGIPALLTNWSFGQLSHRVGAPPGYLRGLPATLAAQNLNHGLANLGELPAEEREVKLLFNKNGHFMMRAVTSDKYTRIWNADVAERLVNLIDAQPFWKLPLAYDRHHGMAGKPDSNGMVPRGAYASDRDMFVFLVDEGRSISVPGSNPIKRGFFVWNSEVGSASFGITTFLYDYVCGNHYVWGAKNVATVRVRHIGDAHSKAFGELSTQVKQYAESSTREIEAQIVHARGLILGKDKEEVTDTLFAKRIPELSRARIEKAYDVAGATPRYGDPRSVWGIVSGLTELAQESENTDIRAAHDRAAGKVMEIAF